MPRPAKGARLYLRKRKGRPDAYVIRDMGGIEVATGTADRREAEAALAAYIQQRHRISHPHELTCGEALMIYGEEYAPSVAAPERIGYAMDRLLPFWGEIPSHSVTGALCRRYAAERGVAPSTVRRELGALRAALRYCEREGYLDRAPIITLPPSAQPKDRWLTVEEAARLLRASRSIPHISRFVLLGLYTGTRRKALLNLAWHPQTQGGWIDLEAGLMYRQGPEDRQTRKRQPPVKLPRKLIAHCRRWRQDDCRWVIHHNRQRIGTIWTGWDKIRKRAGLLDVTPHSLRHTAITWAMQRGVRLADAAGYFGLTIAELERTYLHHHPRFQEDAADAMDRRK